MIHHFKAWNLSILDLYKSVKLYLSTLSGCRDSKSQIKFKQLVHTKLFNIEFDARIITRITIIIEHDILFLTNTRHLAVTIIMVKIGNKSELYIWKTYWNPHRKLCTEAKICVAPFFINNKWKMLNGAYSDYRRYVIYAVCL